VLLDWLVKTGKVDKKALAALPSVSGKVVIATPNQTKAAADYLTANWTAAVGTR
jgi:hypothetical protein